MSKKLIAVAAAAALALTGLVGIAPANASGPAATFTAGTATTSATTQSDGVSSALPANITVPHLNYLPGHVATLSIANVVTGDAITVKGSAGIRIMKDIDGLTATANRNIDVTKLGTDSFSATATATATYTVQVFTTSTAAGTVAVGLTRTGVSPLSYSTTLHLKGVAGNAYKYTDVVAPTTLVKTGTSVVTFKAVDVFGNAVKDASAITDLSGGALSNMGTITWDATAEVYKSTMTSPSNGVFLASITGASGDVTGFADSADDILAVVNYAGASSQVATLTAQIATMRPKATSVTKKRYNTLARKWNAAFPSQKVKLKK
jgi:hypothetical protein